MRDSAHEEIWNAAVTTLENQQRIHSEGSPEFPYWFIDISKIPTTKVDAVLEEIAQLVREGKTHEEVQELIPEVEIRVQDLKLSHVEDTKESVAIMRDYETIRTTLQWLSEDGLGLEAEVIYWALKFMKENPSLGIGEAFSLGFGEWDK